MKKGTAYRRSTRTPHATTRSGRVHRSESDGFPSCGEYETGIIYTADEVNCEYCLAIPAGVVARRTASELLDEGPAPSREAQ